MVMIVGEVWKFLVSAGVNRENCGGKGLEERSLEKVEQVRGTGNSHVVSIVGQFSGFGTSRFRYLIRYVLVALLSRS